MTTSLGLPDLGPVFTRSAALQSGVPAYTLRRGLENGLLERVGRGVYRTDRALADGAPWEVLRAEHLQRCREFQTVHPGHVVSHQSAAAVHALQIRLHPAMNVHLTSVKRAACSRRKDGLEMHHADSVTNDVVTIDGIPTTTLARTVADVLRTSRPPHSVAVLDAAVREGLTSIPAVRAVLDSQVRWRGRPRAREVLALHDPRRESWLESYSFIALHEFGIPVPHPQVEVLDAGFHLVGRVDGLLGTVFLEADGAAKYQLLAQELGLSPQESLARGLEAQQERHDRLVALGLTGVRWTTSQILQDPSEVARRVRQELVAEPSVPFGGWLRIGGRILSPEQLPAQTVP